MTRGQQRSSRASQPRAGYQQRRQQQQAAALQAELEREWLGEQPAEAPPVLCEPRNYTRYAGMTEAELVRAVGLDAMAFTQQISRRKV